MFGTETLQDSKPVLAEPATLRSRALEEGYLFFRELVEPSVVLRLRRKVLEVCRRFGWLAEDAPLMERVAASGWAPLTSPSGRHSSAKCLSFRNLSSWDCTPQS